MSTDAYNFFLTYSTGHLQRFDTASDRKDIQSIKEVCCVKGVL